VVITLLKYDNVEPYFESELLDINIDIKEKEQVDQAENVQPFKVQSPNVIEAEEEEFKWNINGGKSLKFFKILKKPKHLEMNFIPTLITKKDEGTHTISVSMDDGYADRIIKTTHLFNINVKYESLPVIEEIVEVIEEEDEELGDAAGMFPSDIDEAALKRLKA
jgi:hypothetical protein